MRFPLWVPLAIVAAGCMLVGSAVAGVAAADDPPVFRIGIAAEKTTSVSPVQSWDWYAWVPTYDFLVGEDLARLPAPGFAESWASSEDGLVWTYKIWPDLKWSDGEPATANDVAFTVNWVLGSIGTEFELNAGRLNTEDVGEAVESVTVVDDQTVELRMKHPFASPPRLDMTILPEHVWKDVTYEQALTTFGNEPPLVGTGPYVVAEFRPGEFIRLARNEHYRGNFRGGKPVVDEVVISFFGAPDGVVLALESGEIDLAADVPITRYAELDAAEDIEVATMVTNQAIALWYNTLGTAAGASTDAVADPAFRDALSYAIDRTALVEGIRQGFGEPAVGTIGPGMPAFYEAAVAGLEPIKRSFDIEQAKSRLDTAGYTLNENGERLDKSGKPISLRLYAANFDPMFAQTAQYLTDWFGQLGIDVGTQSVEWGTLVSMQAPVADGGGNWDLTLGDSWPDAIIQAYLGRFTEAQIGAGNRTYWTDPQYETLYAELQGVRDPDQAVALAAQLGKIYYEQVPADYLWFNGAVQAYRTDKFEGFVRMPEPEGILAYNYYPELTLSEIRPIAAPAASPDASAAPSASAPAATAAPSASPAPGTTGTGSDNTPLLIGGAIVVVLLAGGALLLRRRGANA